jgi:hypothetical protein
MNKKEKFKDKENDEFKYNKCPMLDIAFREKNILFNKIHIAEFEPVITNLNHRPIRRPHVNKIKANFTGKLNRIDIIYDKIRNIYFVVNGQHLFLAVTELINEDKHEKIIRYPCNILLRKSTGKKLLVENSEDRKLSNRYSYRTNDGQERTCYIDTVKMIFDLGVEYLKKNHSSRGVYKYIFENQYGNKEYKRDNIKIMWNQGQNLLKMGLLKKALEERWVSEKIKVELGIAKKSKVCYAKIKIFKKNQKDVNSHKDDVLFWERLLILDKQNVNGIRIR